MADQKPNRAREGWSAVLRLGERLLNAIFHPGADRFSRGVEVAWLAGLLLFGVIRPPNLYGGVIFALDLLSL